ncbi:MAG: folylpolyglutamate synthase/dihydrofolate synthase family protein [Crocinitomicaceae bacterium]
MTYQQVVDWLFGQLANYHQQGSSAYKPGLENISILLDHIGNPQNDLKSIHIAGTNGKGSTAHMIAAMAIENGYRVGLFTSPHIKDFRERIKINGQLISKDFVINFVEKHQTIFEALSPSFFEITTAMAFAAFADSGCDWVVIETGLGGRLDATNVIQPKVSVITNIGLDHTEYLGNTLPKIAAEKAGIIKRNIPVCIGEVNSDTQTVFEAKAKQENSKIYYPIEQKFELDLLGEYQQKNAALAWTAIQVLKEKGEYFDDQKSKNALTRITRITQFKGRLSIIQKGPLILADASHNIDGIQTLFQEISKIPHRNLYAVYGSAIDKNFAKSMRLFPTQAKYFLTSFDSDRSVEVEKLCQEAEELYLDFQSYQNPVEAFSAAKTMAGEDDLIIVFGSFYILEKIL